MQQDLACQAAAAVGTGQAGGGEAQVTAAGLQVDVDAQGGALVADAALVVVRRQAELAQRQQRQTVDLGEAAVGKVEKAQGEQAGITEVGDGQGDA